MESDQERKPKGYEASYDREKTRLSAAMRKSCERMARDWSDPPGKANACACPRCGRSVPVKNYHVERTIMTPMGEVTFQRHYYYCPQCGKGFYPKDADLELDEEDMTDEVLGWALDLTVNGEFRLSAERLEFHHGIGVSATKLRCLFERKSRAPADTPKPCPVVPLPLSEENARHPVVVEADGSMVRQQHGFGEVKLWDVNVLGSTDHVYLAEARDKDRFERQLFDSPGFEQLAKRKVLWIADGAAWIWAMKKRLCPHAEELLDFYHAMEHAHEASKQLFGEGDACTELFARRIARLLLSGETDMLFDELKACIPHKPRTKAARRVEAILCPLLDYYENNRKRLNYRRFRDNGWPLGSGSVESAHKRVIQKRMKQAGMRWSPRNAQRMATMRALYCSVGPKRFLHALQQACSALKER
jgi:hypothetical protein